MVEVFMIHRLYRRREGHSVDSRFPAERTFVVNDEDVYRV